MLESQSAKVALPTGSQTLAGRHAEAAVAPAVEVVKPAVQAVQPLLPDVVGVPQKPALQTQPLLLLLTCEFVSEQVKAHPLRVVTLLAVVAWAVPV